MYIYIYIHSLHSGDNDCLFERNWLAYKCT